MKKASMLNSFSLLFRMLLRVYRS